MKVTLTKRLNAMLPDYFLFRDYCGKFQAGISDAVSQGCLPFGISGISPEAFEKIAENALNEISFIETLDYAKRFVMTAGLHEHFSNSGFRLHVNDAMQITDDMRIFTAKGINSNPYLANIKVPKAACGTFHLTSTSYEPYELFVYDVPAALPYGFSSPRIGFFEEPFTAPALTEKGSGAWMTITPNEICTMEKHIEMAGGKVLTLGCGLGYFAYMASMKDSVEEVTIIERSPDVIRLFTEHILPQFSRKEKIRIIQADALDCLSTLDDGKFDYCFADIWQSNEDVDLYLRTKTIGNRFRKMKISYWIEESLVQYLLSFAAVIFNISLNRALQMPDMKIENMLPDHEKKPFALVKKLLNKTSVTAPEDLPKVLSAEYLLKLLSKRSLVYPVSR